ncbi:hypothetical protein VNI00_009829 [Paramarasmius palmivorus]|uniref:DUF6593 domain-containing protein n=1 Tax=Paramarasmius palmivorus TaxID=297713 RepID=A0AAW0CMU9_9AGAR
MKLHLSCNYLNATYSDDTGRAIYKVKTPSPFVTGSTTISKVLPADLGIPQRNLEAAGKERFASLGRIDWRTFSSSTIHILDQQMDTRHFFYSEGWSGKLLDRNYIFTAPDGSEYKWDLGSSSSTLTLNDGSKTPIAKFHQSNMGIITKKRRGVLEIFPLGEHMVDHILITFIYVEKIRRDD